MWKLDDKMLKNKEGLWTSDEEWIFKMQNDSNDSIYIEIKNSSKTKVLESSGDGKVKDLYQVQETWKFFLWKELPTPSQTISCYKIKKYHS